MTAAINQQVRRPEPISNRALRVPEVSVVVPTLDRPDSLARALSSLANQRLPRDVAVEIIVVDNSREGSAEQIVAAFSADSLPVVFAREPVPGVATARNAGVKLARGRWVAFLDDDEEAAPDWIANLIEIADRSGADAVFGPISARADHGGEMGALAPYFSRALDRPDGADITDLSAYLGTNNSMFHRARCLGGTPFETSLNETGGEDSLLIRRLVLGGRRFAFAAGACVIEWAPARRLRWAYIRRRKFLSGQVRVFVHRMAEPGNWHRIAFWMSAGLIQFAAAGFLGLVRRPFDRDGSERLLATAWGGLGKVFWARRFRPAMYGSGLVS